MCEISLEQNLNKSFGYVPKLPEQWVIYKDHLIVIHPENKPRIFKYGCNGVYYELDPVYV